MAIKELRKRLLVLYFNGGYEQGISAQQCFVMLE